MVLVVGLPHYYVIDIYHDIISCVIKRVLAMLEIFKITLFLHHLLSKDGVETMLYFYQLCLVNMIPLYFLWG